MLIGITGRSGDGKSTFARILNENLSGSKKINIDNLYFSVVLSHKNELLELYGNDIICEDGKVNVQLYLQYPEKAVMSRASVNDEFVERIFSEINIAFKQYEIVIIEWASLSELEELWNLCNIHILIKSQNPDKRYEYLVSRVHSSNSLPNRLENSYHITMEELKIRDQLVADYSLSTYEYIISNNYDESLFAEGKRIAAELQNLNS